MTSEAALSFPQKHAERDAWILARRGERAALDPEIPYAFLVEDELFASGVIGQVAALFLTNRECPWRCTMCDLWRNTLTYPVPPGAIPRQIAYALARLQQATQIKLYNSGSFFDPLAIPVQDYPAIARALTSFERVIVESHPALIGRNCFEFQQQLGAALEVAMGLETARPSTLAMLNKRMTLEQYSQAADKLQRHGIALRSFILIQPPFMPPDEALEWACRSVDFAFNCGATAISLIPTRAGNGATDQLMLDGHFTPPCLLTVEAAVDYGVSLERGRVFIDLWDCSQVQGSSCCREARIKRLRAMNYSQLGLPRVSCSQCEGRA